MDYFFTFHSPVTFRVSQEDDTVNVQGATAKVESEAVHIPCRHNAATSPPVLKIENVSSATQKSHRSTEQRIAMTSPVNPEMLTINTALETCRPCPTNEKCAICLEMLTEAPPNYKNTGATPAEASSEPKKPTAADSTTEPDSDSDAVKTKVCGDAHFFHRICIMSWFTSADPNLNSCPMDRRLLFGSHLVRQRVADIATMNPNNFTFTDSTGQTFLIRFGAIDHIHPDENGVFDHDTLQANHEAMAQANRDAVAAAAEADALLAVADTSVQALPTDGDDGVLEPLLRTARANVDAARAAIQAASAAVTAFSRALPLLPVYDQNADNALADRIVRGVEPAPRGRPFGNEVDQVENSEFPVNPGLVGFFADVEHGDDEPSLLPGLTPESLEHEAPEDDGDAPVWPFATLPDEEED